MTLISLIYGAAQGVTLLVTGALTQTPYPEYAKQPEADQVERRLLHWPLSD